MGFGGYLLLVGSLVLLAMLVRELWRGLAPGFRHAAERRAVEGERARREEALIALPGGSPERPLEVPSASVVEARATRDPCPVCGKPMYVEEHAAESHDDDPVRAVRIACRWCEHERTVYLRVAPPAVH